MRSSRRRERTALGFVRESRVTVLPILFIAMALLLFIPGSCLNAESFEKRNRLELKLGSWNHVPGFAPEASAEGATSASEISGLLIGLTYGRQTKEWGELTADSVVLATPAYLAANLVESIAPQATERLHEIRYVSTGTVSLGYRRADVPDLLPGFAAVRSFDNAFGHSCFRAPAFAGNLVHQFKSHLRLIRA